MGLIDIVFPKKCFGCGSEGGYLCLNCLGKVGYPRQTCIKCERPSIDGITHIKCKTKFILDGTVSIWNYEGVIRKSILGIKYKFAYDVAKEISFGMVEYLRKNISALPKRAILLPVPIHIKRQNWRGFNQSSEVGKLVAKGMNWGFVEDLLVKRQQTKPQTELKGKERMKSLRGAFRINEKYEILEKDKKPAILFDDVRTTGTTLKKAGKVLKRSGFGIVWGLTIAK